MNDCCYSLIKFTKTKKLLIAIGELKYVINDFSPRAQKDMLK